MKNKRLVCMLMAFTLSVAAYGCGGDAPSASMTNENIELMEPVQAESSYEEVVRRTLYDAGVYSATVVPYLEEYSSDVDMHFNKYGANPGAMVKKGDVLVQSDSKEIDERIEDKTESIKDMQENHLQWQSDCTRELKRLREEADYWKSFVDENEANKPPEMIDASQVEGSEEEGMIPNPAYQEWYAQCGWVIGKYKIADHAYNTKKADVDYETALYDLDLSHARNELDQLYKERNEGFILSGMDGCVVAMNMMYPGDYIQKNVPVTAVGDLERKQLKCDYINKGQIQRAQQVYVLIDGKKYKVEYQVMESEEYTKLSEQNDKVYSTFDLLDAPDVNIGDFGVITLIMDERKDVLTVPNSTIRKDEAGKFVYLVKDGTNVYTPVKTGMTDGVYTEILEGLEEGDKVLCNDITKIGSKREVLKKGEFHTDFENMGFMFYPYNVYLENPIESGTTYFVSSEVREYQRVSKGDVIATVRVEPDAIALSRNERKAERINNRIADIVRKGYEEDSYEAGVVADYRKELEKLNEEIANQKKDHGTTKIVADKDGIIIWLEEFESEDIIRPNQRIAEIADESTCYVVVEDKSQLLQYGNTVDIEYEDENGKKCTTQGMVASMSKVGVNYSLQSDYSIILLPKEEIGNMIQTAGNNNDWWSRFRYVVSGSVRNMDQVVVVPKKAVWETNGKTYVYVIGEDGKPVAQSFVAGGYNETGYWVVEGLTEGMEICLE